MDANHLAAGLAMIFLFFEGGPHVQWSGTRFLTWGLPALMIVSACVLGADRSDQGTAADFTRLLGNSSYALYLLHPLVAMVIVTRLWDPWLKANPVITVVSVGVVSALAISVLTYWYFERPLTQALIRIFRRGYDNLTSSSRSPGLAPYAASSLPGRLSPSSHRESPVVPHS
jgi:peptidoglycan/LPS O-acetylase OafA/YrhL